MMLLNAELQLTMATGPRANAKMTRIFILFYPSSPAQSKLKFELTPKCTKSQNPLRLIIGWVYSYIIDLLINSHNDDSLYHFDDPLLRVSFITLETKCFPLAVFSQY